MKKILIQALFAAFLIPLAAGCSDGLTPDPGIAGPPYTLSPGEAGSADAAIYEIYRQCGNYILYDFTDRDILPTWTSSLSMTYTKADVSDDKKYIAKMVEVLNINLYEKYGKDFAKKYFPYKIMLCATMNATTSGAPAIDTLSGNHGTMAVGRVGPLQDGMTATDWTDYVFRLQRAIATYYFRLLPSYPTAFFGYVASYAYGGSIPTVTGSAPAGYGWVAANHRCWSSGFLLGNGGGITTTRPNPAADLSDYIIFLTDSDKTEIEARFQYYPQLKARTILLYPYLENVLGLDLVALQNKNRPGDKLPAEFFDSL